MSMLECDIDPYRDPPRLLLRAVCLDGLQARDRQSIQGAQCVLDKPAQRVVRTLKKEARLSLSSELLQIQFIENSGKVVDGAQQFYQTSGGCHLW